MDIEDIQPVPGSESETDSSYLSRQFLIAMPSMQDPNFERGVTLICQHSEEGATGININRASEHTLGDIFSQMGFACEDELINARPVLEGGPVHQERGFVLHEDGINWESSIQLTDKLFVTTSRDILEAIAGGHGPDRFLVALGYAGWGAGQLEEELKANAWLTVQADNQVMFEAPLDQRWESAIAKLGVDELHLSSVGGHA